MRSPRVWLIIAAIILLIDVYVFQAVKAVSANASDKMKLAVYCGYWFITAATLFILLSFPFIQIFQTSKIIRNYVLAILVGLFFAKLITGVFVLSDDVRRLILLIASQFKGSSNTGTASASGNAISRSVFLSWLGIGIGAGLFGTLLYGFSNKYNYQLRKVKLSFANLPASFKGLKIIQISDIHSGSFQNKHAVQKGVDLILKQKPDLILFTGDLVNDRHDEMLDYIPVFSQLKAPLGVYSTLGNHDYGDYISWPSAEAKQKNLEELKKIHAQMGWRLLMNEHVVFERNETQIALLGIENWGAKGNFPKYGKMSEAYPGTEKYPFKILMSHDPSHWDAEVKPQYPDIDLTLSGHTHGFQFGVENPYFKWSPVQWMYKEWAGLYEDGKQKLYVNRGFGFLGYPGRVGILPEITLLELA
jgi:Predicted phosphohydrolases